MSVYICPASKANHNVSIINKFKFKNGDTEYAWAYQSRYRNKWVNLKVGDICLFGHSSTKGFNYMATVKSKVDLTGHEEWPYRSKSGNPWTWGFYLESPVKIKLYLLKNYVNIRVAICG